MWKNAIDLTNGTVRKQKLEVVEANDIIASASRPPKPSPLAKLVIIDRLEAAGLLGAVLAAFDADPAVRLRWDAAVEIDAADPDVVAFISALGGDPTEILAPVVAAL